MSYKYCAFNSRRKNLEQRKEMSIAKDYNKFWASTSYELGWLKKKKKKRKKKKSLDRPWRLPSLLYDGRRVSFSGVMRPGLGVDHPPLSSAEVKERLVL